MGIVNSIQHGAIPDDLVKWGQTPMACQDQRCNRDLRRSVNSLVEEVFENQAAGPFQTDCCCPPVLSAISGITGKVVSVGTD